MHTPTNELFHRISKSENIGHFIADHADDFLIENEADYLSHLIEKKSLKISDIAKRSQLGDYAYKVVRGDRKASRDILLCTAIGMYLSLSEVQLLLRIAHIAQLDPRNKRDSVIIYGIHKNLDVAKINEILFDLNLLTF
jgi:hypothetical protein